MSLDVGWRHDKGNGLTIMASMVSVAHTGLNQ